MDKLEMKMVYMIHQLKRLLIKLRFIYSKYAYNVNSDAIKKKNVRHKQNQMEQFGKIEITASCMIFQIDPTRQFCRKHVPTT